MAKDGAESKDAYREQALEEMVGKLADLIDNAHDNHIWAPGDKHPVNGCDYCNTVKEARKLLAGDEDEALTRYYKVGI